MAKIQRTQVPKVTTLPNGSVRVKHREYLLDVPGSQLFSINALAINPGLAVFPWLNLMANLYESYLFNSLAFEFESTSATTQTGTVFLAIDFDAADDPPSGKQELMSMQGAVRTAPWQRIAYDARSQDLKKFGIQRYVRSGALASNLDIKTYDVGRLFFGVQGTSAVSSVGELYVNYDITFYTPQPSFGLAAANSCRAVFQNSTQTPSTPFGTEGSAGLQLIGGYPLRYRDGNSVFFDKPGDYLVSWNVSGSSLGDGESPPFSIGPNATFGLITVAIPALAGANETFCTGLLLLKISAFGAYLVMGQTSWVAITQVVLRVAAYSYTDG